MKPMNKQQLPLFDSILVTGAPARPAVPTVKWQKSGSTSTYWQLIDQADTRNSYGSVNCWTGRNGVTYQAWAYKKPRRFDYDPEPEEEMTQAFSNMKEAKAWVMRHYGKR